jgi:hypothetical protein
MYQKQIKYIFADGDFIQVVKGMHRILKRLKIGSATKRVSFVKSTILVRVGLMISQNEKIITHHRFI